MLLGWEVIGVLSFLLIRFFFGRRIAATNARLACLLNRARDFFLILAYLNNYVYLVVVAVCTKSSLFLFHQWLPRAIEGPTPVSSLLHSSTMVCARVIVLYALEFSSTYIFYALILRRTLIGIYRVSNNDQKKTIANSTSSQLCLLSLFALIRFFYLFLIYLVVHAIFKSRLFFICGLIIHIIGTQIRSSHQIRTLFVLYTSSICRIFFFSVAIVKDLIFIDSVSLVILLVVIYTYAITTVFYSIRLLNSAHSQLSFSIVWVLFLLISLIFIISVKLTFIISEIYLGYIIISLLILQYVRISSLYFYTYTYYLLIAPVIELFYFSLKLFLIWLAISCV